MSILNFGSLNIDKVYAVPHFVQPGETLAAQKMETFCGGKGLNQSIALARAGAQVYHAGKVGTDGAFLTRRMEESGVDVRYVQVDATAPTGHAIIQVDASGQNNIILCAGANGTVSSSEIAKILRNFGEGDILLLQNEVVGLEELIRAGYDRGMSIAINPSPMDDSLKQCALHRISWFLLNEIEGNQLTGATEPDAICDAMLALYPAARIVLTLGSKGALYADSTTRCRQDIFRVPVVDTTAAGDTFTGYFLSCILNGDTPAAALLAASKASAIAVGRAGASDSIPTLAEVAAFQG